MRRVPNFIRVAASLGFLLAATALLRGQTNTGTQTNVSLRVIAANLNGNTQSYQPFAFRIFQGLKPDIVAIQEFNFSNNTPADFRVMVDTAFGPDFVYYREPFSGGSAIPNGIISRYPILSAGSWVDTVQGANANRGFAWAQIDLPGTNELYVVSVHLLSNGGSSDRAAEAANLKALIQASFPANAWIIVAGDFNTDNRSETALATFKTFLSDNPIPADAEAGGNSDTNEPRNKPYDYVLPSFSLAPSLTNVVLPSRSFSNGLVFDSRVYGPLTDVAPVQSADSGNAQHMAVIKDFRIVFDTTNGAAAGPWVITPPQSQTVALGNDATFGVTPGGSAPFSFQWRFNGTNILAATAGSYTRMNVQLSDAGDFSVVITNAAGSVTSAPAALTVSGAPIITAQPQDLSVTVGQSAAFGVSVTGAPPLLYQWRFNATNIVGATTNTYTRANLQAADAGRYTVVITNLAGSVTSAPAMLTVLSFQPAVIARWNFNSTPPDGSGTTGSTSPSIGAGTAALVGGTTATFATGDTSADPAGANDNSGWNTASYPAQGTGNKTAGVRFNVSTAGKENIGVSWNQRASDTGSKYVRLQYSTNGTSFVEWPSTTALTAANAFESKAISLAGIPSVNNNSNFAFRIVSEFESAANPNYVTASGKGYGSAGTLRFDMVTVVGTPIVAAPAPVLGTPSLVNGNTFQFALTGQTGANYVIQSSTNLAAGAWIPLQTNTAPFTFSDTNAAARPQRFYRAVSAP